MTINSKTKLHDPCVSCRPAEVECHPKLRTTLLSKWTIIHQSPVENRVWVPEHMPDSTAKAKLSLSGHLHKPLICGLKGPPLSPLFKKKKNQHQCVCLLTETEIIECVLVCPWNVQIIRSDWNVYMSLWKDRKGSYYFTGQATKRECFCSVYIQPGKQFTQYSTDRIWAFKQPPRHNSIVGKAPAIPHSFELKTKKKASVTNAAHPCSGISMKNSFLFRRVFTRESDAGGG